MRSLRTASSKPMRESEMTKTSRPSSPAKLWIILVFPDPGAPYYRVKRISKVIREATKDIQGDSRDGMEFLEQNTKVYSPGNL